MTMLELQLGQASRRRCPCREAPFHSKHRRDQFSSLATLFSLLASLHLSSILPPCTPYLSRSFQNFLLRSRAGHNKHPWSSDQQSVYSNLCNNSADNDSKPFCTGLASSLHPNSIYHRMLRGTFSSSLPTTIASCPCICPLRTGTLAALVAAGAAPLWKAWKTLLQSFAFCGESLLLVKPRDLGVTSNSKFLLGDQSTYAARQCAI
mmetsp:Transcript_3930/g.6359  ORF Transcript_3930/g.6359 Transcript_3930/m.6359 type:complete len:206 (+) Transcript_3930:2194-2811(+)